jgi:uncharacterized membrane protein YdbT with pleckstrin-like domain
MGYVTENLMPGEEVVHESRLHWVVFVPSVLLTFVAFMMFAATAAGLGTLLLVLALMVAGASAIRIQTSEFAVTNKRVLIKTGLLSRRSIELNINKVESLQVEQDLGGRILDYGTLVVAGSGGTHERFTNIADPLAFRSHVQQHAQSPKQQSAPAATFQLAALNREERECPFCAEVILAKARVCKHCGRDVQAVTT